MTVVVYSSKSGSSKKYAEALSERTGLHIYPIGQQPADESVIFFGWLRDDTIVGLSQVDISKIVAVCVVGLDDVQAAAADLAATVTVKEAGEDEYIDDATDATVTGKYEFTSTDWASWEMAGTNVMGEACPWQPTRSPRCRNPCEQG